MQPNGERGSPDLWWQGNHQDQGERACFFFFFALTATVDDGGKHEQYLVSFGRRFFFVDVYSFFMVMLQRKPCWVTWELDKLSKTCPTTYDCR